MQNIDFSKVKNKVKYVNVVISAAVEGAAHRSINLNL